MLCQTHKAPTMCQRLQTRNVLLLGSFCAGPAGQSHAVANSTVGTLLVLVLMHPLDLKDGVFEKEEGYGDAL